MQRILLLHVVPLSFICPGESANCLCRHNYICTNWFTHPQAARAGVWCLFLSGSSKTRLLQKGRWAGVEETAGQGPHQTGMLSHSTQTRGAEHIQQPWLDPESSADHYLAHSDKEEGWIRKARVRSAKCKATSLSCVLLSVLCSVKSEFTVLHVSHRLDNCCYF